MERYTRLPLLSKMGTSYFYCSKVFFFLAELISKDDILHFASLFQEGTLSREVRGTLQPVCAYRGGGWYHTHIEALGPHHLPLQNF